VRGTDGRGSTTLYVLALLADRFCLLARAASRPQPALCAGERLLSRALSLDPARDSLAWQLRRCSSSVALNLAEGMYSRGQNRNARYHSALGSARETLACLEVAAVCRYAPKDAQLHDQLERVIGTLVKLTRV